MKGNEWMPLMTRSYVAYGCGGLFSGCLTYLIALLVAMAGAPRRPENIRSVVDLPWSTYAMLPTVIAFAPLLVLTFWIPTRPTRLSFIVAFGCAVGLCSLIGIELLRRDYIGKF